MRFTGTADAPSEARLAVFEEYHGVRLPADYRALLTAGNGGVPERTILRTGGNERVVERVLAMLDDPATHPLGWAAVDVVMTQVDARLVADEDGTDAELVPIMALGGGDMLCLDFSLDFRSDAERPPVVLWDHEASDDFAPVMHPVAPDVGALLEALEAD